MDGSELHFKLCKEIQMLHEEHFGIVFEVLDD